MTAEQLVIDGDPELIPGVQRDEHGHVEVRWLRLVRTTDGVVVEAPADVVVSAIPRSGGHIIKW